MQQESVFLYKGDKKLILTSLNPLSRLSTLQDDGKKGFDGDFQAAICPVHAVHALRDPQWEEFVQQQHFPCLSECVT